MTSLALNVWACGQRRASGQSRCNRPWIVPCEEERNSLGVSMSDGQERRKYSLSH